MNYPSSKSPFKYTELNAEQISDEAYVFDSSWHIHKCLSWLDYVKRKKVPFALSYAALNLRMGIEMLWFEIFIVGMGGSISEEDYEACYKQATKIYKLIDRVTPEYEKMVKFTNLICELMGKSAFPVWNISKLKSSHGRASSFLHFQGMPTDNFLKPSWLDESVAKIEESALYIWMELATKKQTGIMTPANMAVQVREIWERYKINSIDLEGAYLQLKIIAPTLRPRIIAGN